MMILHVKLKALCILLDGKPSRSLFPNSLADSTVTFILFCLLGFTTIVANEGLEKARAYLNQVPRDDDFTSSPKDAV